MVFIDLLDACEQVINSLWGSMPDVIRLFTNTVGTDLYWSLEPFFNVPLIGSALESAAEGIASTSLGQSSYLYLMVGLGLPGVIAYSYVKWLVGILNGG